MKISKLNILLASVLLLFNAPIAPACSCYKVSHHGKTMVGSNYDAWLTTPRIWFETTGYGCSFTGARKDAAGNFRPQTGLNEFGLAFITLATATPQNGTAPLNKKQITSRTAYLKDILHTCKTAEEVKAYVDQYDRSVLSDDVFLYVDRSGKYVVVEPYVATFGNEAKYVLANFCPSTISDFSSIKQKRYRDGTAFLKNKIDSSLAFCKALSDTMHVCRAKHGDGTLLTSILDLDKGINYLYFYHDYEHPVAFRLKEELAKGDHFTELPPLFPKNAEFQQLIDFKTPANSPMLNNFMAFCAIWFSIAGFFFFIHYFRKRKSTDYPAIQLVLAGLSVVMVFYVFVLVRTENIFYFPAPYVDSQSLLISIASYIPFLLLVLLIPLLTTNTKVVRGNSWSLFAKYCFSITNATCIALVILFAYWGLYNLIG